MDIGIKNQYQSYNFLGPFSKSLPASALSNEQAISTHPKVDMSPTVDSPPTVYRPWKWPNQYPEEGKIEQTWKNIEEKHEPGCIEKSPVITPLPSEIKPKEPKRYLNIFWNQHQPCYKDESRDEFLQPWVRLHAVKDYYKMAAILDKFPNVHVTINLSSSLLMQLTEYISKLYDFSDIKSLHRGDISYYPFGRLDRWHDLLLKDVKEWAEDDKQFAIDNFFSADYKGQIECFDGYRYLYDKKKKGEQFTEQDFRDLKVWFHLAWTDSMFLHEPVTLLGETVDGKPMEPKETVAAPAALIKKGVENGYKNTGFTEDEAKKLVLDQYAVMKYVVPVHRMLQNRTSPDGFPQIEVVTTPFYHPILPLIYDSNLAALSDPGITLVDPPFQAPSDAYAHVIKGKELYKELFGKYPAGMWPGEGAVAEEVVPVFQKSGIKWIATGQEVLFKSEHAFDNGIMYRIDCDKEFLDHDGHLGTTDNSDAMSIVFRSDHDRIGFDYGAIKGGLDGDDAAKDFLERVRSWQHSNGVSKEEDILYTTMADGENCWQNYINNGNDFLKALYGLLNKETLSGGIKTITPAIHLAAHPIDQQFELEQLGNGGWVGGSWQTWSGEPSENDAWKRLGLTRKALVAFQVPKQDPKSLKPPDPSIDRKGYFAWKAWESIYAAEGSDWFWWFGNDQRQNPGWQPRYADDYRMHLINAITFARQAGYKIPFFQELIRPLDASTTVMPLPPITTDPKGIIVEKPFQQSNKTSRFAALSIKAGMDPITKDKIHQIKVNLSPLAIKEEKVLLPAQKTQQGVIKYKAPSSYKKTQKGAIENNPKEYSITIPVPASLMPGTYVIPVTAESTGGAVSRDFISIEIPPIEIPPNNNEIEVPWHVVDGHISDKKNHKTQDIAR